MSLTQTSTDSPALDAIVVGAGFAGLYMLHRLRQLGLRVRVLEAGSGVGGTWFWNRYPGARCDVESVQYSYSFSPELQQEWRWSEKYATQPEILRYIEHVADRFDLRRDITLNTRVTEASFDATRGTWRVGIQPGGSPLECRFLIMAVGCLSSANHPKFPGLDQFAGRVLHTGEWPHEPLDFSRLRVAVIGTGSSGIQCIPQLAAQAASLTVFQRTPNFAVPAWNEPLSDAADRQVKADYAALRAQALRRPTGYAFPFNDAAAAATTPAERAATFERFWQLGGLKFMGAFSDLFTDVAANRKAAQFVREKIRGRVHDPAVAERLLPSGIIGSKRLCVETQYYETFNRDNVELVDLRATPIESFTPQGLRLQGGGREFAFDVVVFATGFDAMTGSVLRVDIVGRDGARLRDAWRDGARTYLGLGVAGFPNLFLVNGPGSPSVLSNMVQSIEHNVDWTVRCLAHMRSEGWQQIEADSQAQQEWVAHCNAVVERTLRAREDSWYVGANIPGRPRVFMPYAGGVPAYRARCDEVAATGYRGFRFSRSS
jgi:cyclohexanone monooxygenase